MNYKAFLDLTNSQEFISLKRYYNQGTIWDSLGVARQENPHSSFIRSILDRRSNQGLEELPYRKLMETVCLAKEKLYNDYEVHSTCGADVERNIFAKGNHKYFELLKKGNYSLIDLQVANELIIINQRRADIITVARILFPDDIEKYIVCLIENKVGSEENTYKISGAERYQTEIYEEAICDISNLNRYVLERLLGHSVPADNILLLMLYLNAHTTTELKDKIRYWKKDGDSKKYRHLARSKQFLTINYQYLLDGVIEPLIKYCTINTGIYKQLEEYVICLGQAQLKAENEIVAASVSRDDDYIIMAVSETEKRNVFALWQNDTNREVILNVLNGIGGNQYEYSEQDLRTWKAIAYVLKTLSEPDETKQNMLYTIHFEKDELSIIEGASRGKSGSRKHKFIYNGIEYESFKKPNIGVLCHDIIKDVMHDKWDREKAEGLLEILRKMHANWLREVGLFEDQVAKLPGIPEYKENEYKKAPEDTYRTCCKEEFEYAFFCGENEAVRLIDKSLLYIGKFWGSDDLAVLLTRIKEYTGNDVKIKQLY